MKITFIHLLETCSDFFLIFIDSRELLFFYGRRFSDSAFMVSKTPFYRDPHIIDNDVPEYPT